MSMTGIDFSVYLKPTLLMDYDHESIQTLAGHFGLVRDGEPKSQARRIFNHVRDEIKYNFYPPDLPALEMFRASDTLARREGFCIPKAILLASMARLAGIPAGLGFATIRNHRLPDYVKELMGTDLIRLHGFAMLYLDGKWVKVTPAFDSKMCRDSGLAVVDFDGSEDAMFPARDLKGRPHIDYVHDKEIPDRCFADVHPEKLWHSLLAAHAGQGIDLGDDEGR